MIIYAGKVADGRDSGTVVRGRLVGVFPVGSQNCCREADVAARLNVMLPGMDEEKARRPVQAASQMCPYSRATSRDVEVHYNAITSVPVEVQHA